MKLTQFTLFNLFTLFTLLTLLVCLDSIGSSCSLAHLVDIVLLVKFAHLVHLVHLIHQVHLLHLVLVHLFHLFTLLIFSSNFLILLTLFTQHPRSVIVLAKCACCPWSWQDGICSLWDVAGVTNGGGEGSEVTYSRWGFPLFCYFTPFRLVD